MLECAPGEPRWAVEFRDARWLCEGVFGVLREHNAALVVHDLIAAHPRVATADWVYARYHGAEDAEGHTGGYPHQRLAADAERFVSWLREGRDVYAFFNNDVGGHAPRNASQLAEYITRAR